MTPKAQKTKEKICKLDFIKTKIVCPSKNIIKRVKRQVTEWEAILAITFLIWIQYSEIFEISYNSTTKKFISYKTIRTLEIETFSV